MASAQWRSVNLADLGTELFGSKAWGQFKSQQRSNKRSNRTR